MAKLTRTTRFEVQILTPEADRSRLIGHLLGLSADLTRAANKAIGALYQLRAGTLEAPVDATGKPVSELTLAGRALQLDLSIAWQPLGRMMYTLGKRGKIANLPCAGGVRGATANAIQDRIKTDYKDVVSGKKALSTFRELPIYYRASEVRWSEGGSIALTTFDQKAAKAAGVDNRVIVRPVRLDPSRRQIVNRCASGRYKHGQANLSYHSRKRKWFLSVSWTDENFEPAEIVRDGLVCGLNLGITHAVWMAYRDQDGTIRAPNDVIGFPADAVRAAARVASEYKSRAFWNRKEFGLRSGRGRGRKLRVTEDLSGRRAAINDTMVRTIAAGVVARAKWRGVSILAVEDTAGWAVERAHIEADRAETHSAAAEIRAFYFTRHAGALRLAIIHAAERKGLMIVHTNPAHESRDCASCGKQWRSAGVYADPADPKAERQFGRYTWRKFKCTCGWHVHADRNAALNSAKRAVEGMMKTADDAAAMAEKAD